MNLLQFHKLILLHVTLCRKLNIRIQGSEKEEYLYKRFYPTFVPNELLLLVHLLLSHGLHLCPDTWELT